VLTDTAELHYQAWARLCREENLPFSRTLNEQLRGISRPDSLALILQDAGQTVSPEDFQRMADAKNSYYQQAVEKLGPGNVLPGAAGLLKELRQRGLLVAVVSASRNAGRVLGQLGLDTTVDLLVDGNSPGRAKPAPDFFLLAARLLQLHPAECIVVEDAAAGIEAAHAAGMAAVGIGPLSRSAAAEVIFPDMKHAGAEGLLQAALWRTAEPVFQPGDQGRFEAILTSGNGYLCTRGTFEERFPEDTQAVLIHGVYDDAPVVFTELANAPDWSSLSISINGQQFRMDRGTITDYARWLDLRTGVLHRRLRWKADHDSPAVDICFSRFASLHDEHILAQRLTIRSDQQCMIEIHASVDSRVENENRLHWKLHHQASSSSGVELSSRTRSTNIEIAYCMLHTARGFPAEVHPLDCPGVPGVRMQGILPAGQTAVFDRTGAVFTSRDTSNPMEAARISAETAARKGYEALQDTNSHAWSQFWDISDVLIHGDPEAQLALRHGLFQLRIAAPTHDERVSIPAKALSGFAYAGHIFWDTEIFILPFFMFTHPDLARTMLMYRRHTLEAARNNAAPLRGARYPWESAADGTEVTPAWVPDPGNRTRLIRIWTGDLQLHITSDIAYAMHQYWKVTGDDDFWRTTGIPVLLETAIFWADRAEAEGEHYSLRDVIGCDEYHDHVDNNAFTNYLVRWHLRTALSALDWLKDFPEYREALLKRLTLTPERLYDWQEISEKLVFLQDPDSGLIEQFEGFFRLKTAAWEQYKDRNRSMQELLGIEGINDYQVLKQPDVLTLFSLFGSDFNQQTWQVNWDTYHPITDHSYGSSLGPAVHARLAARLGDAATAYEHFMRAARADLADVRGNVKDGIHAASAGGLWQAVVFGFAGLQLDSGEIRVSPCLPSHWKRLEFHIRTRGKLEKITLEAKGGAKDK